jgi:hypothetical protein
VMDAWRTSCPKLPVWEEANECGFVERTEEAVRSIVRVSSAGLTFLEHGRPSRDASDDAPRVRREGRVSCVLICRQLECCLGRLAHAR